MPNLPKISLCLFLYSNLVMGLMPIAKAHNAPKQSELDTLNLETIVVEGRATDLFGVATSASQGVIGQTQFAYRPLMRVGELIEVIPGALATQHSGSGKANQYFLRGFNLDHGTDFSVTVDGIPMNMPSHAHGQGYLDLNSIIPELVGQVEYGKGTYYAESGDFSSAGFVQLHTMKSLPQDFLKFTVGEYDYYRTVIANSHKLGVGNILYAGELQAYNGVWQRPEDLDKFNGQLSYNVSHDDWGYTLYSKAYHSTWNATNQIPQRAIDNGDLNQYASMDFSDGGATNRYSVSSNIWSHTNDYRNEANVYALYSDLNLFSNFTGYMDNPVQGDQIQQHERRIQMGGNAEQTWYKHSFGIEQDYSLGLQVRHDEIMELALNHTQQRQWLSTVRNDDVSETSVGLYGKHQAQWLKKFRTITGLRVDLFDFNVSSHTLAANSGSQSAALLSPKLSLIFGPRQETEFFINLGYGYHSNDARGTTLQINPVSGDAAASVSPLVWSRGGELGVRNQAIQGLNTTLALWWLQLNSELVFVGDAGSTEPTGRSERQGLEWSNYYTVNDNLTLDADLAFTTANYTSVPTDQQHIPNSVGRVITAGAVLKLPYDFFTTLRLRHFGNVPLNENGSFYAGDTTLVNWSVGYEQKRVKLELDLFNIFNAHSNDIAYAYASQLQTESVAVDGVLKHVIEPRMVRITVNLKF